MVSVIIFQSFKAAAVIFIHIVNEYIYVYIQCICKCVCNLFEDNSLSCMSGYCLLVMYIVIACRPCVSVNM